jgi:hypothetical protein
LHDFPVLKITQKYTLTVSCFNVLFNFDHDGSVELCLCDSVYEQNYGLIINVLIVISYHYLMFMFFLFTQHVLLSLKCSEEDCLANFVLRKDARLNNPGACSLEFQSVMQILTEHKLIWDTKTKTSTGKGILGTVRAFAGTDEEQGQKTLH